MKKIILGMLLCSIMIVGLTGCGSGKAQVYNLGDSFEYNGLKITLGNNYKSETFVGDERILVPITFENISDETKELGINFTVFGPDGSEIGTHAGLNCYSGYATKLKSGGELEENICFTTEKSGKYTIEINNSKISIDIIKY